MARYVYEWKPTEHGSRLFRRPGGASAASAPTSQPEPELETETESEPELSTDYSTLLKDDLVAEAEQRGIDSSGTKADIIERLEADDDD